MSCTACVCIVQGVSKVHGHFSIQINDSFRILMLMKVFQFYVHRFLYLLLKYQYPAWPSFFCIMFLSCCGVERASSLRLACAMFRQAYRNLYFSPPITLGIGSLYAALSIFYFIFILFYFATQRRIE